MPSGGYSDKERQPVYQKALEICHEEEKELSLLQQDLERSKLQSFLSYKLEERHLRNELIRIKREQRRLAQEAKQRKKDNKSIDDIAKEIKARDPANTKSAAILFEKKFALPQINCTPKNVPKILRRKLSDESEYFTWTFGLPNIENRVKSFEEGRENKEKEKIVESKVGNDSEGANDDDLEIARGNTVHSIVFNIPVSPPREGKTQKQSLPSISIKTPIIEVTSSEEDAHVCKNAENGPLDLHKKPNRVQRKRKQLTSHSMQTTKCIDLHKRNVEKETDSIRKARARQERLDEIGGKIERAKQKCLRTKYHEKVQVLNELATIHHVFEPLYVIDEGQERLEQEKMENEGRGVGDACIKLPRLLPRRAESENGLCISSKTEPKLSQRFGGKMKAASNSNNKENSISSSRFYAERPRYYSWSQQSLSSEASQMSSALQNKREYIAKLRAVADKPCVSDTMSSVTMGYTAFKRLLKNKRRQDTMARKLLNSKLRSLSLDETKLSVIPEFMEEVDAQEESSAQIDESNSNKQDVCFSRHLPTPVSKRQLRSTLSWPLAERTPTDSLPGSTSNETVRARDAQTENLFTKQRSLIEEDETEAGKEGGIIDDNSKAKVRVPRTKCIRFRGATKLIKPMGTGCFSQSFQAVTF